MAKIRVAVDPSVNGAYTPLAEGTYDFEITATEQGTSKQKGTPQITCTMQVIGGPASVGKEVRHWVVLHPKSAWKVKLFLEACGVPYEEQKQQTAQGEMPILDFDDEHLVGARFRARIEHQKGDNGKVFEQYQDYEVSPLAAEQQPAAAPAPAPAPVAAAPKPVAAPAAAPAQAGVIQRRRVVPPAAG